MSQKVERPAADKKKIHNRNEFELCYLRHQYFRRANYNPTPEEMKPYDRIVERMASKTYHTYVNLFRLVGLEREDVISIGSVHLVSFLGLFSLERMPEKYEAFSIQYREKNNGATPTEWDERNKDKSSLTLFLKQRMEDLVRVCRQKARNIKGLPTDEYYVYYGPHEPPLIFRDIVEDYEKMGFKKLDVAIFKTIKKKIKPRPQGLVFKFENNWYISVPVEQSGLSFEDLAGADMNPYDSLHNMNPEQILFAKEDEEFWASKQQRFDNWTPLGKIRKLRKFVKSNANNPKFQAEVKTALFTIKKLERSL